MLDKELRRQVTVAGRNYTVSIDAEGLRLTGKGKRKPELELRWLDLLSGDAALAVALNASLVPSSGSGRIAKTASEPAKKPPRKKPPS
ncbi:hypothetical protein WKW79_35855 [Variovorax robiniae]|uniref:Uncharacterized protein n=1 Tax=Variovorax robiniae TaxID=1836199 RepID=A0ABU8XLJ4_9BURK